MDLALVTFAVGKRISFLAKVHGRSVLRQEFSIPENARWQCNDRPRLTFVEIRYGATRSRRCGCVETSERPTAPAVLPAVSHREVRFRQRRGVKLPGQRILLPREGGVGASRHRDC